MIVIKGLKELISMERLQEKINEHYDEIKADIEEKIKEKEIIADAKQLLLKDIIISYIKFYQMEPDIDLIDFTTFLKVSNINVSNCFIEDHYITAFMTASLNVEASDISYKGKFDNSLKVAPFEKMFKTSQKIRFQF